MLRITYKSRILSLKFFWLELWPKSFSVKNVLKVLVLFWRLFPFELQTFRNPEIEFSNMLLAWQKILLFSKQETKKLKSFIPQRKSIILPVNLHTEIVCQNKKHRLELLEALNDYECFKTMQTFLKTIEQLRKYFQQKMFFAAYLRRMNQKSIFSQIGLISNS